jgi:hypothetical protein
MPKRPKRKAPRLRYWTRTRRVSLTALFLDAPIPYKVVKRYEKP